MSCKEWTVRLCGRRVCCHHCERYESCGIVGREYEYTCSLNWGYTDPKECQFIVVDAK